MSVSTRRALSVSVGLSLLFVVVYGGCLWITSRRANVGAFYFEWEREIPFVPFMIIPYLSIDLFFVATPFLFRRACALENFAWRATTAIIIAGLCFLIVPLRFAFPQPLATGWVGALFDSFRGVDAPYNLFPSLHAALLVLLFDAYFRHLRSFARWIVLPWFVLIGLSPLLTHQHHLIDIVGGFVLGAGCLCLIGKKFPLALPEREGR